MDKCAGHEPVRARLILVRILVARGLFNMCFTLWLNGCSIHTIERYVATLSGVTWPHFGELLLPTSGSYYSILRGVTTPYFGELLLHTSGSYYYSFWFSFLYGAFLASKKQEITVTSYTIKNILQEYTIESSQIINFLSLPQKIKRHYIAC